ncbi:MAG: response regulator transcription factor, partial [Synergistaceae bacterium]|nr:response regulator transcription factor [Synergistaceae bacterium]
MTRIIIADDHDLFVEGMKGLLDVKADVEFAGQAHDGLQAVEQAALLKPDIILIDVAMPIMNGIKALKEIRAKFPEVRVLMLSM